MGRLTVHSSFRSLIVTFPEPMAESICPTSSCPGLRRWPRNLLRIKEKNLRCKFGKIETSNVGRENEGNQEGIAAGKDSIQAQRFSMAVNLRYVISRARYRYGITDTDQRHGMILTF